MSCPYIGLTGYTTAASTRKSHRPSPRRLPTTSRLAHSPTGVRSAPAIDRQTRSRWDSVSHSSVFLGRVIETRQRASTHAPHISGVGAGGASNRCWDRWRLVMGALRSGSKVTGSTLDVGRGISASSEGNQCMLRFKRLGMCDTGGPGKRASLSSTGVAATNTSWVHPTRICQHIATLIVENVLARMLEY